MEFHVHMISNILSFTQSMSVWPLILYFSFPNSVFFTLSTCIDVYQVTALKILSFNTLAVYFFPWIKHTSLVQIIMNLFPLYMNNTTDNIPTFVQISPYVLYSNRADYIVISHLLNVWGWMKCFVLSCPVLLVWLLNVLKWLLIVSCPFWLLMTFKTFLKLRLLFCYSVQPQHIRIYVLLMMRYLLDNLVACQCVIKYHFKWG